MGTEVKNDLASFHRFVGEQLQDGGATLSPEQVLGMWRDRVDAIDSIRRGLQDIEAGRMRPADEVLRELREGLQG